MGLPVVWQRRLNGCRTPEDVLFVSKDFITSWSAEGIGKLPVDLIPETLRHVQDVADYALRLMQHQLAAGAGALELQQMIDFFVAASQRLSQLMATPSNDTGGQ